MGLLGAPFKPSGPVFYFRVSDGARSFETALTGHPNVHDAYDALRKIYPGRQIAAVNPTEFAEDGLPWFPGCGSPRKMLR